MEHERLNKLEGLSESYDTSINVIGGLKDISKIIMVFETFFDKNNSVQNMINERNELGLRTEKSRKRIEAAIKKTFLSFENENHIDLMRSIFCSSMPVKDKEVVLFWQFALNNLLFREISSGVFLKTYYSGRVSINKNDIIAFLKELIQQNESLQQSWSESTVDMLASKYLNIMSKLGFLTSSRIKSFNHIRPSSEIQVLFLYFLKLTMPQSNDIFVNEFLPLGFVTKDELQNRLKKLSQKGLFNMNFNGIALNIELTHSYKGICDALY